MYKKSIKIMIILLLFSSFVGYEGNQAAAEKSLRAEKVPDSEEVQLKFEITIPKSKIELSLTDKPRSLTRGEISHFIVDALGIDASHAESNFTDVPKNHPYYNEISILNNFGILNGFPDGTFHPENYMTRGDFATFLTRALLLKGSLEDYSDSSRTVINDVKGHRQYHSIVTVVDAGLMKLDELENFNPHHTLALEPEGKLIPIISSGYTDDNKIIWSSSNPEIAEVDEVGQVTPKSVGKAIITASSADGSSKATSEVMVIDEVTSETYKKWESKENVPVNKNWTITFNDELDKKTVHRENIYIHDNQMKREDVKISLNEDKKSITITAPENGYTSGEAYVLSIEKGVASTTGEALNTPVKFEFTIE